MRHATGALVCWNDRDGDQQFGVYRWVTADIVLVEALFAVPGTGLRPAMPWKVISGDASMTRLFPSRLPIDRAEFDVAGAHPIDLAFDQLKPALRRGIR
jgi:hypothetical protein